MSAILAHPKAAANAALAQTAITNGLSVEQAGAMLAAMPEAAVAEATEPAAESEAPDVQALIAAAVKDATAQTAKTLLEAGGGSGVEPGADATTSTPLYGSV